MAACKPLFVCADLESELYKVIYTNKLGFTSPYGQINQAVKIVSDCIEKNINTEEYVNNGAKFVANYDREKVLNNMLNLLTRIVLLP